MLVRSADVQQVRNDRQRTIDRERAKRARERDGGEREIVRDQRNNILGRWIEADRLTQIVRSASPLLKRNVPYI